MRWLGVLVVVAGCDRVWFLDRLPDPTPDAQHDAAREPDADPLAGCPTDFTFIEETGTSYKLVMTLMPWDKTRLECRALTIDTSGAKHVHLAVVGTLAEYNVLRAFATDAPWIGGYDPITNDGASGFVWVTAEPNAGFPWGPDLPDLPDVQNCLHMQDVDGVDDLDCYYMLPFLCECDAYPDEL